MRQLLYNSYVIDNEIYVCILPEGNFTAENLVFDKREQELIDDLLGEDATLMIANIWHCGSDANVTNRLALPGFRHHPLPLRYLKLAEIKGWIGEEEEEDDEEE